MPRCAEHRHHAVPVELHYGAPEFSHYRRNRFGTETVSSVVTEFGGAVVEFNGDGMMAVFGAPRHLENKERAAVLAAKRLAESVPKMNSETPLAVGVG